jgi:hypothetical protein
MPPQQSLLLEQLPPWGTQQTSMPAGAIRLACPQVLLQQVSPKLHVVPMALQASAHTPATQSTGPAPPQQSPAAVQPDSPIARQQTGDAKPRTAGFVESQDPAQQAVPLPQVSPRFVQALPHTPPTQIMPCCLREQQSTSVAQGSLRREQRQRPMPSLLVFPARMLQRPLQQSLSFVQALVLRVPHWPASPGPAAAAGTPMAAARTAAMPARRDVAAPSTTANRSNAP